jgi:hypothetical protein
LVDFAIFGDLEPRCLRTLLMEDAEREQEDERLDIQASYSPTINSFKGGLKDWLEKKQASEENEDFEDRDLDALLLKVLPHFGIR